MEFDSKVLFHPKSFSRLPTLVRFQPVAGIEFWFSTCPVYFQGQSCKQGCKQRAKRSLSVVLTVPPLAITPPSHPLRPLDLCQRDDYRPDFHNRFSSSSSFLVFCPSGLGWRQRRRHFYPQVPFPRGHGPTDGQWDHPLWWHPGGGRPPDGCNGRAGDPRCPHLPHWGSPLTSGCRCHLVISFVLFLINVLHFQNQSIKKKKKKKLVFKVFLCIILWVSNKMYKKYIKWVLQKDQNKWIPNFCHKGSRYVFT